MFYIEGDMGSFVKIQKDADGYSAVDVTENKDFDFKIVKV